VVCVCVCLLVCLCRYACVMHWSLCGYALELEFV
jgi:hypothetical protein